MRGCIIVFFSVALASCIAQKPIDLIFTESGKGAGVESGDIVKTSLATPATISSTLNLINQAVTILEFTVKENGSRDGYPLQIRALRFTHTGTADIADLRFVLEGPGSNNTVAVTTGNSIIFKDFGDIIITDGDQTGKTYQLKAQLRSSVNGATTENQTIAVNISPSIDAEVIEASSNILPSVAGFASGSMAVSVVATHLRGRGSFQIGSIGRNNDFTGVQSIYAEDANGRLDIDFAGDVSLHPRLDENLCPNFSTGNLSSSDGGITVVANGGIRKTAVSGVVNWTNLQFDQVAAIRISATASGISVPECTAVINVTGP